MKKSLLKLTQLLKLALCKPVQNLSKYFSEKNQKYWLSRVTEESQTYCYLGDIEGIPMIFLNEIPLYKIVPESENDLQDHFTIPIMEVQSFIHKIRTTYISETLKNKYYVNTEKLTSN